MENPDALLVVSYGGPERIEDVQPFLDRILFGKKIPETRRLAALQKYYQMNGRSPIQSECRKLIQALASSIREANNPDLPFVIYWGNLYAPPLLAETIQQMKSDGIRSFVFFPTSSFGTAQSCQRYLHAVQKTVQEINSCDHSKEGERSNRFISKVDSSVQETSDLSSTTSRFIINEAFYSNRLKKSGDFPMNFVKMPLFLNHSSYLRASADALLTTLANDLLDHCFLEDFSAGENEPFILFSAHSLPRLDAVKAHYQEQLEEHCRKVIQMIEPSKGSIHWKLVFQSRSGSPHEPWTEPAIENEVRQYKQEHPNWNRLIISPIGFFLENMETVYDLDIDLAQLCRELKISFRRVPAFGNEARVVKMIVDFFKKASDLKSDFHSCSKFCDLSCQPDFSLYK